MDKGGDNGQPLTLTLHLDCWKPSQDITLPSISPLTKVEEFLKDIFKLTNIPTDKLALLRGFPPERISYHPSMTIQDIGISNHDTIIVELDNIGIPGCVHLSNTAVSDQASTTGLGSNLVEPSSSCPEEFPSTTTMSVVDPSWELIDPNPDINALFDQFNKTYFWNRLGIVTVEWNSKLTRCGGNCKYIGTSDGSFVLNCRIKLSLPLLKLRPRKDLIETLLHEMIHAYLFLNPVPGVQAQHNRGPDRGHGPDFQEHMRRINGLSGANVTIYHSFLDELEHYKVHWWQCNGPCHLRPPYYGLVKRSMNRAPSPNDRWWKHHAATCSGTFIKVREPPPKENKNRKGSEIVDLNESSTSTSTCVIDHLNLV